MQETQEQTGSGGPVVVEATDQNFVQTVVEESKQRPVVVDRGSANHRVVDLELPDEIDRRLADDAAVGAAHHAANRATPPANLTTRRTRAASR